MSISQLIATQYQRNAPQSPARQLAGIEQLKTQQMQNQSLEQGKSEKGMKFAANIKMQLDQIQDPAEKNNTYTTALHLAKMNGHDISMWPQQYDEQAQGILDVAHSQVYEPAMFEQRLKNANSTPAKIQELNELIKRAGITDPSKIQEIYAQQLQGNNELYTSTKVAEDGSLMGINRKTGTATPINTGGATFKGSGTTVNINNKAQNKGLTEEQKALGKSRVKRFEGLQEAADNAIDQDEQLAQLEGMDVETGFGVDTRSLIASAVNAVAGAGSGDALLDVNLPAIQAFKSVSKRMVNSELNKAKGPQTEGDARRAEKTVASLGNEMLANKFIIKSLRATNARKIEQSEFYQQVLERDGTLKNADKEWAAFKRKTPMLSATVMDRETGLPMFFNEFRAKTLERNPQATVDQIINAWRDMQ